MGAVKQAMLEEGIDTSDENADVKEMVEWFLARYEDPVHHCPFVDGEYVYGQNGPIDAAETIQTQFGEKKDEADIERAFELIEASCTDWDPIPGGPADPDKDDADDGPGLGDEDDSTDDDDGDIDPDAEED